MDPSGLYITVAEKDSETFKNAVSVVFGESVKFMYDEENPDRIIGFSYDGKVGSKTTADLFNFMANDAEAEYSIGFYNVSDGSKGTSDGNKAKNSYWLNVNQSNADIYEQIARIAHEATHLYTLTLGYNDAVE